MNNKCFNCNNNGAELYGFIICDSCKKELRLFTDKTIEKHIKKYTHKGYEKDVKEKLSLLENVYLKKKIKLLDILTKLEK